MSLGMLYLISILPNVQAFMLAISVVCASSLILGTIAIFVTYENHSWAREMHSSNDMKKKAWTDKLKIFIPAIAFLGLLTAFIPTERQLYMITGGYFATNIEGINKLPANLVGAVNTYLEKATKEDK